MASIADRNLLFGILALQNDFITRDALVGAFGVWVAARDRPLGSILVERGELDPADFAVLEPMVERHIAKHGQDPQKSLAAVESASSARVALDTIGDFDVQASLGCLGHQSTEDRTDADDTQTYIGRATATGGRFRVLRFHDRGGLGEVFVARDEEVHREVALKQLRSEHADDGPRRARFVVEAEITGGLEHPGIVPVYGLGHDDDGRPFYAMRFIRGQSLKDAIERFHAGTGSCNTVAFRELLGRFLDVCDAIAYAHSRGVLHRDLKPGNVMLGPYGETLVVDWGLAKAVGRRLDAAESLGAEATLAPESGSDVQPTEFGERFGTLAYMPPEQAAGRHDELGPRSDVYSLGATLYALLTGQAPFMGKDQAEILRKIEQGDFPSPRSLKPWVDSALEAVVGKAIALRPDNRYASPRELAEDLQRWMADEPVTAWREPWPRRAGRWIRGHRTLVSTAAAASLVAALGLSAYAAQRVSAANGRVDALPGTEIGAVPALLRDLRGDRWLVRDRLRSMSGDGSPADRLRGSLALLPDDRAQGEYLTDRMLDPTTTPDDLLVIRQALSEAGALSAQAEQFETLIEMLGPSLSDTQLRAFGALVGYAPAYLSADAAKTKRYAEAYPTLAAKLATENPLYLGAWREVFQPVAASLVEPLRTIYADRSNAEARDRAFTLLYEFAIQPNNPRGPEDLAVLLIDSDPPRLERILGRLTSASDQGRAVALLEPLLSPVAKFDDALAERQGRVCAALMRLQRPEAVWPLFAFRPDPSTRTELIHELAPCGVSPKLLIERLLIERNVSARRALVLALGEYPPSKLPESERRFLIDTLLRWYQTDPDSGLHGAVDWILRQRFQINKQMDAIDRDLALLGMSSERNWYVDRLGQTFAIVSAGAEFQMGSTQETDPDRNPDETFHRRRIPRPFAIATKEVTSADWRQYLRENPQAENLLDSGAMVESYREADNEACAITLVSFLEATRYCNWLSRRDGIPAQEWCYPEATGPGAALPHRFEERSGYRLPTEGEWEYACRSGTVSSRPFGRSRRRLAAYAWYQANSGQKVHAVGGLKPNDLGLFDVLGNACEWCNDEYSLTFQASPDGSPFIDAPTGPYFREDVNRVLRGGTWGNTAELPRSANRTSSTSADRKAYYGFRIARTITASK